MNYKASVMSVGVWPRPSVRLNLVKVWDFLDEVGKPYLVYTMSVVLPWLLISATLIPSTWLLIPATSVPFTGLYHLLMFTASHCPLLSFGGLVSSQCTDTIFLKKERKSIIASLSFNPHSATPPHFTLSSLLILICPDVITRKLSVIW